MVEGEGELRELFGSLAQVRSRSQLACAESTRGVHEQPNRSQDEPITSDPGRRQRQNGQELQTALVVLDCLTDTDQRAGGWHPKTQIGECSAGCVCDGDHAVQPGASVGSGRLDGSLLSSEDGFD